MTELVSLWVNEIHYGLEANRYRSVRPRCGTRRYRRRRQTRSHISLPTYYRRLGERRIQETALLRLAHTLASLGRLTHELASSQNLRQLGDVPAILRASSLLSNFAAERQPGSSSK